MKKESEKPKILVVLGPTASGKSELAIELAKKFNAEVISADSRQVYRGLDIGTAKTTKEEMDGVPHYLIDAANSMEVYNAADFKRDAEAAIADIVSRGSLPIVAGGTFFYVDTLLGRITLPDVPPNEQLRKKLEEKSAAELFEELQTKDPRRAAEIDPQNKRRLIRALEIARELDYVPLPTKLESPYNYLLIGIETNKEELRERFAKRASEWLRRGFLNEIETVIASGVTRERLSEIGFEYRLGLELLDKKIDKAEFIQKFIAKNWQYAKRQMTWLKRDKEIKWFTRDDPKIFDEVEKFLTQ